MEQVVSIRMIVVIHDLKRRGLSISAIARKTGLDRKTVKGNAPETHETLACIDWGKDATGTFMENVEKAHGRI